MVGEKPYKINDDGLDCLRYITYSENLKYGVTKVTNPLVDQRNKKPAQPYLDPEAAKQGRYVLTGMVQDFSDPTPKHKTGRAGRAWFN